jgi:hypothetical protein
MRISNHVGGRSIFALVAIVGSALGHEIPVHRAITVNATISALNSSPGYNTFLNSVSADCDLGTATNAIANGSGREDDFFKDDGGARSLHHFYDPLTGLGLSNIPYDDRPTSGTIGIDSFTWASKRNSPGTFGTFNVWSWQNARDYQWLGLTAASSSVRHDTLINMFRAVGQVVHLVEDASQPEHVRNEQHLTPSSPIENFGGKNVASLSYLPDMLDWKAAGFRKLEDFWDRQIYTGSASSLGADANGGLQLGIAEFSNGNFLGGRHVYAEYFIPGRVEYYPFPSRDTSTNYKQVKSNPSVGAETYTLKNGQPVKGIYLKKNSDGVVVNHHSRMNYLGAKKVSGPAGKPFCTIKDDKVQADYHARLIPKAVAYSAGLIDYFFRGYISVEVTWDSPLQKYTLKVRNDSDEAFGSGGTFTVLKEMANGDRASIYQGVLNATLAPNGTVDLTFDGPVSGAAKFIVVYKGTIGLTGSSANDPVDANIAIATTSVDICQTPECWIATVQINKATPEFTVGNLQVMNQESAYDYWEAICLSYPILPVPTFVWTGTGCTCWDGFNNIFGVTGLSEAMVYCTYSANLTFANVTLHPTVPWTGAPFTMLIASGDARIQFTPSSVSIPIGFSSDIQLTLTQTAPFTATIKGDLVGNCIAPTPADWQANTTPALSPQP